MYRTSFSGQLITTRGIVHYKFLELNLNNRQLYEELMGNRVARIIDQSPLYISREDHAKLWPENPHDMLKKGYTLEAEIVSYPLYFGGVGYSKVVSTQIVKENPTLSK